MSNKVKYSMPADDEDEIEDGMEMVDLEDEYEDDQEEMDEYDQDGNDENNALRDNQDTSQDNNVYDQDSDDDEQAEEEDRVSSEINVRHQQQQLQQIRPQNFGQQQMQMQPSMGVNQRMRPQSAKTAPANDQFRFQQFAQQNQMMVQHINNPGYSHQALVPGTQGYQNHNLNSMTQAYQQPNLFYPQQSKGGSVKRRPGTASRRNQMQFGKKSSSGQPPLPPNQKTSASQLDVDVSKLRPRHVQQERERLYDDVMKQRITTNNLKEDNTKLRTKLHMLESELLKKDKVIDDLILQQEHIGGKFGVRHAHKPDSHLVINLKRKIKDMRSELTNQQDENEALKRNIRNTRMSEHEVELKMYMEECARLRLQLEEVIRSKDTFADPQELKIIEEKFQQRDMLIGQLQMQNHEFTGALQKKDEENRQLAELIQSMENKMKKAVFSSKNNAKFKKEVKGKDSELSSLRQNLIALKHSNQNYATQVTDLQERINQLQRVGSQQARVPSAYVPPQQPQNQSNPAQAAEIKRLQGLLDPQKKTISEKNQTIATLQKDLQAKNDSIAEMKHDLVRFKDLSENYMKEVTRLEAQLEAADLKPKSKMSQRPKDNVTRDANQNQASIQGTKIKSVEPKQLREVFQFLKLSLQKQEVIPEGLQKFFFSPYVGNEQVSITALKKRFEDLHVSNTKSLLLARFLIEPQSEEAVFNDSLTETQEKIIRVLKQQIGSYNLYDIDGSLFGKSSAVVKERDMQVAACERLGRFRGTVVEALMCEDYDEEGMIDIMQLKEALFSVDEELSAQVLDYLLYYVFMRSESLEKMQYRHIIVLLDNESKVRATSASRKSRPESSSPEKLKMRNPDQQQKPTEKEEVYSQDTPVKEDEDGSDTESYLKDVQQMKKVEMQKQVPPVKTEDSGRYEDDEEYDESPRPKNAGGQAQEPDSPDDEDLDEEEMIDVAEKIFVRIAEELLQRNQSVRATFQDQCYEAEIDDEVYELLPPQGLLEGIKSLGIHDLREKEVKYLLKVLSKPELDDAILLLELLQIFENFGLYDEDERGSQQSMPTESPMAKKLQGKMMAASSQKEEESNASPNQPRKGRDLDLSKLDQKSVKHMVMLMLFLLEQNMTVQELFQDVSVKQLVKTKNKQKQVDIVESADFFQVLMEAGIRKKATENPNLREFLQISPNAPDKIRLSSVKRCMEQMAENEDFMNAIRKDVLEQAEGDEIDEDEQDYEEEMQQRQASQGRHPQHTEGSRKLATVGESVSTHEKHSLVDNGRHAAQEQHEEAYDEDFEERAEEDYEF